MLGESKTRIKKVNRRLEPVASRRGSEKLLLKYFSQNLRLLSFAILKVTILKAAMADMSYFARSTFSRSLVHKKKYGLI